MHRDPESNTVVYDAPPIYEVDDEDELVIYLFDEMDKATKQLQAAALHLVLDKAYWQYELPRNSIGGRKIFCVYGEKSSLIRTRYV